MNIGRYIQTRTGDLYDVNGWSHMKNQQFRYYWRPCFLLQFSLPFTQKYRCLLSIGSLLGFVV